MFEITVYARVSPKIVFVGAAPVQQKRHIYALDTEFRMF